MIEDQMPTLSPRYTAENEPVGIPITQPRREPILQFFAYEHLRPDLQAISRPFGDMAGHMIESLPRNPERTVALRKLLEAKDAAVRSVLYKE